MTLNVLAAALLVCDEADELARGRRDRMKSCSEGSGESVPEIIPH
jgi:hypothetical protein